MSDIPAIPFDFASVVNDSQAHIRAYIAGLGVPRHDVDDVAQDVFVELYRFSDRIPPNIPVKQWLKGIARNLCMNYFRRTSRRQRLQREALVEIFLRAEKKQSAALSEGPVRRALDGCCEKLSPESQRLLASALRTGVAEPHHCRATANDGRGGANCAVSDSHDAEGLHRQEPDR